jgi:integrase
MAYNSPAITTRLYRIDVLRAIIGAEGDCMPRKYQNAKLDVRKDVARPYYFIWVTVPRITAKGVSKSRERRQLGFVDAISKKEAMKLRAEVLEAVNAGRVLVTSQLRFKDVAKRFLDVRVPQLGFAAQSRYRGQIANHILPAFGTMQMCQIDRPSVEAWLASKERAGLGWWSRIDLKGILSAIFTTARNWKLWEGDNPTEGVRIGRKKLVREKRLLTAEQLVQILAGVDEQWRFLILILLGLGLRISEGLGLKWRDIDFEAGTLKVSRRWYRGDLDDTKNDNSAATLQLGPLAVEFRNRYPGPQALDAFVFVGDDGRMPPDDRDVLRYEFRPVLKRLKLYYPGFGWHAFRRQNITWRQTVGGATPIEAQKAARHGSLDMTLLYTLSDASREAGQVQAIFDKLMGTDGPVQ